MSRNSDFAPIVKLVNFEEQGAIAEDLGLDIAWKNGKIMNETLKSLQPGLTNHFQYWLFSKIFSYLFIGDIFSRKATLELALSVRSSITLV